MSLRRKDNMTDLGEWADKKPEATDIPPEDGKGDRQVLSSDGDTITLGQKKPSTTRGNSLELSGEDLVSTLRSIITKHLDSFIKRNDRNTTT